VTASRLRHAASVTYTISFVKLHEDKD